MAAHTNESLTQIKYRCCGDTEPIGGQCQECGNLMEEVKVPAKVGDLTKIAFRAMLMKADSNQQRANIALQFAAHIPLDWIAAVLISLPDVSMSDLAKTVELFEKGISSSK
jgi:hypothetical protein